MCLASVNFFLALKPNILRKLQKKKSKISLEMFAQYSCTSKLHTFCVLKGKSRIWGRAIRGFLLIYIVLSLSLYKFNNLFLIRCKHLPNTYSILKCEAISGLSWTNYFEVSEFVTNFSKNVYFPCCCTWQSKFSTVFIHISCIVLYRDYLVILLRL